MPKVVQDSPSVPSRGLRGALRRAAVGLRVWLGFGGARGGDAPREVRHRRRDRASLTVSALLHALLILASLVGWHGCRHRVPAGVPMGKGNQLTAGRVVVQTPKRVQRKRKVRQSPVSVYEMIKDEDLASEERTAAQFTDNVGVPGGIGQGAAAAGSPHGTALGGKLYFYRVKFKGPGWDANRDGVRPLMNEVLAAGVVKKVAGYNNVVTLNELAKHTGEFLPNMLYMTGTGGIEASDEEVGNLRTYLTSGGMLFADVSGGSFHESFTRFMQRVLPGESLRPIEFDHEIYRGRGVPYAMVHGCPLYRRHPGAGPALGIWLNGRLSVFYSRGDLGSAWGSAGLFQTRRREVEQAFRMGINIISYSLLYYKVTGEPAKEG